MGYAVKLDDVMRWGSGFFTSGVKVGFSITSVVSSFFEMMLMFCMRNEFRSKPFMWHVSPFVSHLSSKSRVGGIFGCHSSGTLKRHVDIEIFFHQCDLGSGKATR
jgi:hypothetical protein